MLKYMICMIMYIFISIETLVMLNKKCNNNAAYETLHQDEDDKYQSYYHHDHGHVIHHNHNEDEND